MTDGQQKKFWEVEEVIYGVCRIEDAENEKEVKESTGK